jgi:hypothetical protein
MAITDGSFSAFGRGEPTEEQAPASGSTAGAGGRARHRSGVAKRVLRAEFRPLARPAVRPLVQARYLAAPTRAGAGRRRRSRLGAARRAVIRAQHKAADARKKGPRASSMTDARHSATRAVASAGKPAPLPTVPIGHE